MRFTRAKVIVSTGIITLFFSQSTIAQVQEKKEPSKKSSTIAPAEKLPPGWDEVDQRLIFLMVRLANTETSLEAIEKTINKSDSTKTSKAASARRAETRNIVMDRKGGGPVSWNVFYGTTAEKFFYHPVDANSTYHTATVLSQQGPGADNKVGGGVPASQGLPVHQRPPQFDYIYRSNERVKARAEADVAALNGKMSSLIARRQRLEAEQAELWVEIAFRAIDHYDLNKKPLLRYEPLLVSTDPDAIQHVEIVKSNTQFMRVALSIIETAKNNQASAFKTIQTKVSNARTKFDDALLQQGVDVTEKSAPVAKFAALAKRLDDMSKNLSESYEVATEGDEAKDEVRKETFRGMLQQSLVSYAQIILAMDEMCVVMQKDWKIKPDLKKPLAGEYQNSKSSVMDDSDVQSAQKPGLSDSSSSGCKVIWKIEKDGNSTITISRPSLRTDSEKDSVVKHDDGTVEFNHVFSSKEDVDKAFRDKPDTFSFDPMRKGLVVKPAIGKLGSYAKIFRYPVLIEFVIESSQFDKNSTLAISGNNNRIGVGVLLNISSQDSFKSNAIVSGTEVKFLNGKSVTKPIFEKQTIDLSESKEIPCEAPHMNDDEVISFTLGLRGETPFVIRDLSFRGQVIPAFGIKLGEKNSLVTADSVMRNGLGESIGMKQGDVIISINGNKPTTIKDAMSYLSKVQYGMESEIVVKRGGKVVKIGFTPDLE